MDARAHWNGVYERKGATGVSWFQPSLHVSLSLIDDLNLPRDAGILDVGGGASTLMDDLLDRGYRDLTVLDLSGRALEAARARLGIRAARVGWIEADITQAEIGDRRYDLWHDRAVFHFLTDPEARRAYVRMAERALKPGGHIIVATFAKSGPEQCSGLDVVRYDPDGLHAEFGGTFQKVRSVGESHQTPWGTEQEFLYCYCRFVPEAAGSSQE